jgi:uncharacterized delta-60 repeat protein
LHSGSARHRYRNVRGPAGRGRPSHRRRAPRQRRGEARANRAWRRRAGEVRLDGGTDDERDTLAVEPDGQILLGRSGIATLTRLNPDGTVDPSFGAGGSRQLEFGAGYVFALGVAVAPDGRILVTATPQSSQASYVRRYLPDGSPDATFGTGGEVAVVPERPPFYSALAVQPDGKVVLAMDGAGVQIARLSSDGTLDSDFGSGGAARVELGRRRWSRNMRAPLGLEWRPLTLRDGRIRIPVALGARAPVSRMGVVGLTVNGHVERRFGPRGLALGPRLDVIEGGEWPRIAVTDVHGGVVVAGSATSGDDLSGEDATVVRRFRRNGAPDLSFGHRGVMTGTLGSTGGAFEQQLAMLDGDTAVLAEEEWIPKYQSRSGGVVSAVNAGYDPDDPAIALTRRCRSISVRVTDISGMQAVVVRAERRVIRRTGHKRFRVRVPEGIRRISLRATDLAGNVSIRRVRLPRC